ncbi:MAG: hypothetical protein JW801_10150, partial [Bacteroidales bacterium]|nr:hypothetical protein [Bacteroidales bacterium]
MKRFQLAGWVLICLSISSVSAQTKQGVQSQYSFKQLTVDQGLSNNRVNAICEDARGFIWFGTENGADRFDGQSIISYKNDPDNPHTLSSNQINAMFLDSRGTLWFATSEGLDHYDYSQGDIVRFSHKDIKWPIGNVEAITEDQDGKLWIGAQSGLYAYDLNSSKISYFSNKEDNPLGLPPVMIYKLLADQYNNIWISPYREGLCVYDQSTETLKCFKKDPDDPTSLSGNQIERLYEDQAGNIWAGTMDDGMNKYTPGSQSFVRIIPDANNSYTTRVRAIFEDLKGNFFVGTRGGLYVQTGSMDGFMPYAYEGHNFSNLSQNSILCSYIDKSGTLWIGTFSGGVNYSDLHKKGFVHYRAGKDDNHFLNGSNIYCMTEDLYGNLWIGGDDGLNFLERSTYTFRYYLNDPDNPHSISYNDIKALEWDDKGNLWIGTNKGGLNYYDVQTGKFTAYRHDINDPASIAGDKIYGLLNDSKNDLWVITNTDQGTGYLNLDILPSGSETFIHLNEAVNYGFDQDGGGNVYIGGVNGFWVFSRSDSSFQFIEKEEWIGSVNAIRKDSENMIWVGSRKGLVRYDPFKESFISFSQSNGYPVYEVFGILEDDAKSLWVSTDVGLLRMGNIVRDPENPDIRVFDSDDGLQSKQFNYNAYYKSQSGEMMFGGINGFNTFFPKDIVDNPSVPGVVITDLKIFNKSVPIGKKVSGRQILEKSISVTKGIRLGRKQNIFTFEFAALHYADPPKNVFRYKLEGFDEDWQYRKAGNNFATYSNLPAGDYTFKVSAANPDGKWNPVPAEIKLSIIPPFWRTWWFITLLILLIGTTILFLWKMREKNLKADRERLEKQLEIGKEEIRKQQEE